jgi:hypothetical protein
MSQTATAEAPRLVPEAEVRSVLDDIIHRMEAVQQRPAPVRLKSWEEIERFAEKAARSGMVPKDYIGKPDAICIAVQMGSELGLPPMQAIQNIAVVNGRPAIWGDAIPGLCRASGKCRSIREWHEGEGDALTYYCEAIRADDPQPVRGKFSVADAKRAKLWSDEPKRKKQGRDGPYEVDAGPWYSYPERMLQMRARGFCLRDAFPDVLKGLMSAEEAQDIPFEATGLKPAVPAQEPVAAQPSERDRLNAAVPLQPEPEKKTWAQWAESMEIVARDANNTELGILLAKAEVVEIVRLAGMGQPSPAKARIIAAHRTIEERYLADPPEPDDEGEDWPAEPEKVAAG